MKSFEIVQIYCLHIDMTKIGTGGLMWLNLTTGRNMNEHMGWNFSACIISVCKTSWLLCVHKINDMLFLTQCLHFL